MAILGIHIYFHQNIMFFPKIQATLRQLPKPMLLKRRRPQQAKHKKVPKQHLQNDKFMLMNYIQKIYYVNEKWNNNLTQTQNAIPMIPGFPSNACFHLNTRGMSIQAALQMEMMVQNGVPHHWMRVGAIWDTGTAVLIVMKKISQVCYWHCLFIISIFLFQNYRKCIVSNGCNLFR